MVLVKNGRKVRFMFLCLVNVVLVWVCSFMILVMLILWVCVSCVVVCKDLWVLLVVI